MKNFTIIFISLFLIIGAVFITNNFDKQTNKEPYRIAFIRMKEGGQFWGTMRNGARTARTETSTTVDFYSTVNALDIEGQIKFINTAIDRNANCIIITPCDNEKLVEPLKRAEEKGIKVIQLLNEVDDSKGLTPYRVMTKTKAIGTALGESLIKDNKELNLNVLLVSRSPAITSSKYMIEGLTELFNESNNIEYHILHTNSPYATPTQIIENYLKEHENINTIIALDDDSSEIVTNSIIKLKKGNETTLITTTHSLSNIQNLDTGIVEKILIINSFAMGYQSIFNAIELIEGKPFQPIDVDYTIVTKENMFDKNIQMKLFPQI